MAKRWKRVVAFTIFHYIAVQLLEGFVFLMAHLPPGLGFVDQVIVCSNVIQRIVIIPKGLMRAFVPVAQNYFWLNAVLALATSLMWGTALALLFPKKERTSLLE